MKVTSAALPRYWARFTGCPSESRSARGGAGLDGAAATPAYLALELADWLPDTPAWLEDDPLPLPPQPARSRAGSAITMIKTLPGNRSWCRAPPGPRLRRTAIRCVPFR